MCLFWGSNTHHLNTTEDNFEATNPYVQRSGGDSKNQEHKKYERSDSFLTMPVPAGSPSRGGDVAIYVFDVNQPSLPTPFHSVLESISVFMALSTVFHSINSPDNSPFSSLCSSGLISALLVLSTIYLFTKVPSSSNIILCG